MPFVTESAPGGEAGIHLSPRSAAALAAGFVLLLLAGIAAAFLAYRTSVAERWVDHTLQVGDESRDLLTSALQMQGSVRGYLLTGDPKFLEPFESASAALPAAIDRVEALVADNSGQQASLAQVRSRLDRLVERYRMMLATAERDGRDAAIVLVREGGGEDLMAEVRRELAAFADAERRLLEQRRAEAEQLRRWALGLVFGALLATMALAAFLARSMLHFVDRLVVQSAALNKETRLRRNRRRRWSRPRRWRRWGSSQAASRTISTTC